MYPGNSNDDPYGSGEPQYPFQPYPGGATPSGEPALPSPPSPQPPSYQPPTYQQPQSAPPSYGPASAPPYGPVSGAGYGPASAPPYGPNSAPPSYGPGYGPTSGAGYGPGFGANPGYSPGILGVDPMTGQPLSDKSKVTAGLLQLVLGGVFILGGVGRLYAGSNKTMGIIQICASVAAWISFWCGFFLIVPWFISFGVWVWFIVDGIMLLAGRPVDDQGRLLRS